MNYRFCCYGTYNKNMEQCLMKCPDREDCEIKKEVIFENKIKERENKNGQEQNKQIEILS